MGAAIRTTNCRAVLQLLGRNPLTWIFHKLLFCQVSRMATVIRLGRSSLVVPTSGCKCLNLSASRGPILTLKRGFRASRSINEAAKPAAETVGIPYSKLTLGVPKETFLNEKRVAITPAVVSTLGQEETHCIWHEGQVHQAHAQKGVQIREQICQASREGCQVCFCQSIKGQG